MLKLNHTFNFATFPTFGSTLYTNSNVIVVIHVSTEQSLLQEVPQRLPRDDPGPEPEEAGISASLVTTTCPLLQ